MKTLEEIKNEVAIEHGYRDWNHVLLESSLVTIESLMDGVTRRYALEVAKEALKNAAENVDFRNFLTAESKYDLEINTDSITNESNIPELI